VTEDQKLVERLEAWVAELDADARVYDQAGPSVSIHADGIKAEAELLRAAADRIRALEGESEAPEFRPELWANPAYDVSGDRISNGIERLKAATNVQQKGTPDQLALVWRIDVMNVLAQLAWRIAQSDNRKARAERLQAQVEALFAGGFIEAGTRLTMPDGHRMEWAQELDTRLEPLRVLLSKQEKEG
jgi:hypothetical protein